MSAVRNVILNVPPAAIGGSSVDAIASFNFRALNAYFPTVTVVELVAVFEDGDSAIIASTLTGLSATAEVHKTDQFERIEVSSESLQLSGRWPDRPGELIQVQAVISLVQCENEDSTNVLSLRVAELRSSQRPEYTAASEVIPIKIM